mmetsp:Transcript_5496/g.8112  ORF Transcript_5496/g.8112 Transcript_5496/m.8112 type:complete len:86 (+) Transcript_5496:83-340(+)
MSIALALVATTTEKTLFTSSIIIISKLASSSCPNPYFSSTAYLLLQLHFPLVIGANNTVISRTILCTATFVDLVVPFLYSCSTWL